MANKVSKGWYIRFVTSDWSPNVTAFSPPKHNIVGAQSSMHLTSTTNSKIVDTREEIDDMTFRCLHDGSLGRPPFGTSQTIEVYSPAGIEMSFSGVLKDYQPDVPERGIITATGTIQVLGDITYYESATATGSDTGPA